MTFNDPKKRLANLIIAGVNKAGSTSLFYYLSAHPDVCGSKEKETCYFLPLLYNEPISPIEKYVEQFTHCTNSKYRLEATPAYVFGGEKIATEILTTLGPVKTIIILKDPVQRLISFYQRKKATFQLPEEMDLREYVQLCLSKTPKELELKENQIYTGISLGLYHEFFEPWLKLFASDLKVVFFDDLKKDSSLFMKNIADWLEIDSAFYDDFEFDIKNKSHNYKNKLLHKIAVTANTTGKKLWRSNPELKKAVLNTYYKFNGSPFKKKELPEDTLELLQLYFKPHNAKLKSILKQYGYSNLPQWLEQSDINSVSSGVNPDKKISNNPPLNGKLIS